MGMNCAYCDFELKKVAKEYPLDCALCTRCACFSIVERGWARRPTNQELIVIRQSPAYRELLEPAIRILLSQINRKEVPQ